MSTVTDRPPVVAPSVFDALLDPDRTAAQIAGAVPQGLLVEALVELTAAALSVDGRIDALVAVERHIAMLQARSSSCCPRWTPGTPPRTSSPATTSPPRYGCRRRR